MSTIRFGATNEYQIFRRDEIRSRWTLETASRFLAKFKNDTAAMAGFRKLAGAGAGVGRGLSDQQVLQAIARQMVSGQLLIAEQRGLVDKGHLSGKAPEASPEPPPRERQSEAAATPDDPETFEPDHDGVAQANVLIAASASGVPFCEQCSRDAGTA
jgi:hypothetical protein